MEALIAFILALIMLLTGCGRTRAEVIPEAPKTETAVEAEPQETVFVPVTAEERLAYAFADMAATEALEGAEDLVFEGTLNGSPLFYSQEESLNFSALGSSDVTYYREIGYRSGVGDEEVSGHYTVNYDGNSLVSLFDSGKKNTQKASPDALSKNIRASLTAFLDRDAALGYTVLGQKENGSELTISFTADEERIYDLFDRSLTLMGEGFGEDLSGSVYGATERNGGARARRIPSAIKARCARGLPI